MKNPEFGFNAQESYVDFFTTEGTLRLGKRDDNFFVEQNGERINLYGRKVNQVFNLVADLSCDLTHYDPVIMAANSEISVAEKKIIGGSAEIRIIGNGVHTPTFAAGLVASTGSDAYDNTLNKVNKIVFYYDGVTVFYSITVLA